MRDYPFARSGKRYLANYLFEQLGRPMNLVISFMSDPTANAHSVTRMCVFVQAFNTLKRARLEQGRAPAS